MHTVEIDAVESDLPGETVDGRGLSDPLGTTDVAINRYGLAPGARVSGLHAHLDQEEVFLVVEGVATFETWVPARDSDGDSGSNGEAEEVVVEAAGAVRFNPGDFQSCTNRSDDDAVVYALGAPRDTEEFRVPIPCPDCGREDMRPTLLGDSEALVCPDCGTEEVAECPSCGGGRMTVVLDEAGEGASERPVECCKECGATAEPE